MKKIHLLYMIFVFIITSCLIACENWTEIEAKHFSEEMVSEEYYAALRAYKKSPHSVFFGWFGGWAGEGTNVKSSLAGLPDSVDFVSIWGGWHSLTEAKKADLKFVQEKKGLKALACILMFQIGDGITPEQPADYKGSWNDWQHEFWGWKPGDEESINAAIVKYANALCDTIDKYNLDGFDLDAEPSYAQPFETNKEMWRPKTRAHLFIQTIAKRIGPKAETPQGVEKLLVVDGEPEAFPAEMGNCFNYFILQSYRCSGEGNLESRLNGQIAHFASVLTEEEVTNKLIVTETIEAVDIALGGGYNFTDPAGNRMKSVEGMARWQPRNGFRKGGMGTYHMEAEYGTNPDYRYLRNAIQIMNPSALPLVKY